MKKITRLAIILILLIFILFILYLRQEVLKDNSRKSERLDNIIYTAIYDLPYPKKKSKYSKAKDYYKNLEKHNNDSQNVHNSTILIGLSRKLARLKELVDIRAISPEELGLSKEELEQVKYLESISQIRAWGKEYFNTDEKKLNKMHFALDKMSEGMTIISINTGDKEGEAVREDYILALIWERIHHAENSSHINELKSALLDNIIDTVKTINVFSLGIIMESDFQIECITGRVARLLSSFTLIDADAVLAEPEKDEKEIANEAYYKAYSILQKRLKEDKMEELYNKNPCDLDKSEALKLAEFERSVKDQIKHSLLEDYKNILDKDIIEGIVEKAQGGV